MKRRVDAPTTMGDVVLFRGPLMAHGEDGEAQRPDEEARFWLADLTVDDGFGYIRRALESIAQGLQDHPDFRPLWEAREMVDQLEEAVARGRGRREER